MLLCYALSPCYANSATPPPSSPRLCLKASSLNLVAHLNRLSSTDVVAWSCVQRVAEVLVMPRLRHRMRSHRGTHRRAPSHPSSNAPFISSDLSTGHYPRTRSGRGRLHLPGHFPPDSSSSPSFGLVIFTFNCSLNHPRITAHVSVFLLEEGKEAWGSSTHQEGLASVSAQIPLSM